MQNTCSRNGLPWVELCSSSKMLYVEVSQKAILLENRISVDVIKMWSYWIRYIYIYIGFPGGTSGK